MPVDFCYRCVQATGEPTRGQDSRDVSSQLTLPCTKTQKQSSPRHNDVLACVTGQHARRTHSVVTGATTAPPTRLRECQRQLVKQKGATSELGAKLESVKVGMAERLFGMCAQGLLRNAFVAWEALVEGEYNRAEFWRGLCKTLTVQWMGRRIKIFSQNLRRQVRLAWLRARTK